MYIESLLESVEAQKILRNSLSQLYSINMFAVLMELQTKRNIALPSTHPLETNALRASWHDGYVAAIEDLYYFFDKYVKTEQDKPVPTFGAAKSLLDSKEITEEEYASIVRRES